MTIWPRKEDNKGDDLNESVVYQMSRGTTATIRNVRESGTAIEAEYNSLLVRTLGLSHTRIACGLHVKEHRANYGEVGSSLHGKAEATEKLNLM